MRAIIRNVTVVGVGSLSDSCDHGGDERIFLRTKERRPICRLLVLRPLDWIRECRDLPDEKKKIAWTC